GSPSVHSQDKFNPMSARDTGSPADLVWRRDLTFHLFLLSEIRASLSNQYPSVFSDIISGVLRDFDFALQRRIINRLTGNHLQRDYARPGLKRQVFFIVEWRALPHFGRELLDRKLQCKRGLQFLLVRLSW